VNADPQYLIDRLAIRDLVEGYAFRVDSDDPGSASELFSPDGELRIFERGRTEPVRERTGREAIAAAMAGLDRYDTTLHVVGNHRVEIDGDAAEGETYCLAHHIHDIEGADGDTAPHDYVMHIRYLDRFARTDEGWRIARRHLQVEFTEDRPIGTA
jgi:hypothetical protein